MAVNRLNIRPLEFEDFPQWLPLWDENNQGVRDENVTTKTWSRLIDPKDKSVNGLCAAMGDEILGIVHYIVHPTTGHIHDVCYMQDLFVDPKHRGKGIGKRLVNEVTNIGMKEKWARMYWLTPDNNMEARAMYENFGVKLNFSFYVLPLV